MVMAAFPHENLYPHLQDVLDETIDVMELEQRLRNELLVMLRSLAEQREALTHIERGLEEADRNNEVDRAFDVWRFVEIADPDSPEVREALPKLPNSDELLDLLNRVVSERRSIVARKEGIDETVLKAWRQKNSRFSSMGVIESDVQSENLKDVIKLARC